MESLGLPEARLTLLKFGLLATFRIENPPRLLKIADPGFRSAHPILERSLRLSAWLSANDFPTPAAAEEGSAMPLAIGEAWAGIWRWEDADDTRPEPGPTGELLRRLHVLLSDCPVSLPEVDQLDAAQRHTAALREKSGLDDASVDFLLERANSLQREWDRFGSALGVDAIHGDVAVDNVLSTPRGPVLIDLDNAQVGPREWDLVRVLPGAPGGWEEDEWAEFARGYGYDVRRAAGGEVLRDVRHLRSLVYKLGDPRYTEQMARGRRLLEEWKAAPEKRCFELDWS